MSIKCDEYSSVCVIEVRGEFAGETAQTARKALEERIGRGRVVDFALDLAACPFIDSEGLETLLAMRRRCEERFGQIKLVRPDNNLRKILEITRLEHCFECQEDLASALKTMR